MRYLIFLMIFLLAACGSQADNNETSTEDTVASDGAVSEPSSEEAAPTESSEQTAEPVTEPSENKSSEPIPPSEKVEIIKDERSGIVPERIEIPAIDVDASVKHLGLLDNGEMAVPESLHDTSWFEPGYKVGAPGNSVIAGHVDDTVNPGVFKQLHTLEPGDEIIVHGESGKKLTFKVYDKQLFDADKAPVQEIFGYSHRSLLNLITCEGPYNYDVGGTPNRWVVYTELEPSQES
ncbi:class F sortase [Salinicoccus cyprini]|uniref:Class F sortase n=1 Tax=Salinicoccus cyprini TaxID=2493691 RepID=A0A558AXL7_9STAP|nr:class F sortase [Salinicoccus cyprini]TVT28998.1 class F sortase [Salinicoccus cyprini]